MQCKTEETVKIIECIRNLQPEKFAKQNDLKKFAVCDVKEIMKNQCADDTMH